MLVKPCISESLHYIKKTAKVRNDITICKCVTAYGAQGLKFSLKMHVPLRRNNPLETHVQF